MATCHNLSGATWLTSYHRNHHRATAGPPVNSDQRQRSTTVNDGAPTLTIAELPPGQRLTTGQRWLTAGQTVGSGCHVACHVSCHVNMWVPCQPTWQCHVSELGPTSHVAATSATDVVEGIITLLELVDIVKSRVEYSGSGVGTKRLVPSCFVSFDLEPLSLSFDFVFCSKKFKSLSFRLDCLCHLAILCLDQHAHTLHLFESLLTISPKAEFLRRDL
ncbi:hypothetical protein Tco_0446669 [Tanacetum coccineum]